MLACSGPSDPRLQVWKTLYRLAPSLISTYVAPTHGLQRFAVNRKLISRRAFYRSPAAEDRS